MKQSSVIVGRKLVLSRFRILEYLELMKPELTGLSVLTTLCGFYLASNGSFDFWLFGLTAIGTTLVGGGAGALNQYIERQHDARMRRTERRPLPSGRLMPGEVLVFGVTISIMGIFVLTAAANPLTGFLATLTITTYLFLYTPLKKVTPLNTLVGGVPGALPPVMGWVAVRNEITVEALILFAILFFWQIPHFLSLAWMYRKDYARAGYKMLTVVDEDGSRTSVQLLACSAALLPTSVALTFVGMTGFLYFVGALLLGAGFLAYAVLFAKFSGRPGGQALAKRNFYSRQTFFASLLYLPALLFLMTIDKV
ncbi:MAG: heme o synthase [Bacteroidota bacterium]